MQKLRSISSWTISFKKTILLPTEKRF